MQRRISINIVREEAEHRGYTLVSTEYIKSSGKLLFICPNGHEYMSSWDNFRKGKGCRAGVCNKHRKDFEKVKIDVEERGFVLLDDVYVDNKTPMNVLCSKGHKTKMSYINLVNYGKGCLFCYKEGIKPSIGYLREYFKSEGCTLLSNTYKNNYTYLEYVCSRGHRSRTTWGSFKGGKRCERCQREDHKVDIAEVIKVLKESKYTLIKSTYSMAKEPFDVICPEGHRTTIYLYNFKKGSRCGACDKANKTSKPEKEIVSFIKTFYGGKVKENVRSVIYPYELDIYLPSKKLAVEYCGLYWHCDLNGKNKYYHFNKMNRCAEKGIRLVTIFEDEYLENKEMVLDRIRLIIKSPNKHTYNTQDEFIISDLRWDLLDSEKYYMSRGFVKRVFLEPLIYKRIKVVKHNNVFYGNVWDCGKKIYEKV